MVVVPRSAASNAPPPRTPDGHYIVVKGRLWRATNPNLDETLKTTLIANLMTARRAVRDAGRAGDAEALSAARAAVNRAKHGLGERGAPWWTDGAPDLNRRMVRNTVYAAWWDERDL